MSAMAPKLPPLQAPLAERSDTARTPASGSAGAWMREMERAQINGWFGSAKPAPQVVSISKQAIPTMTSPTQAQAKTSLALELTQYSAASVTAVDPVALSGAASTPSTPSALRPNKQQAFPSIEHRVPVNHIHSRVAPHLLDQLFEALAASRVPVSPPAAQLKQTDLHLHIEPDGNGGVAAWMGTAIDPAELQQQMPLLLETLRRSLHSVGLRLNSLTLNGRVIWQPSESVGTPHIFKEISWPSNR